MKTINLEIFTENEGLCDNIVDLICRRDKKFLRNLAIEKILNEKNSHKESMEELFCNGISLDNRKLWENFPVFGEIYEDDIIGAISLSKATHVIRSISFDENRNLFTAEVCILDTHNGKTVQLYSEEGLRLRPVYLPGDRLISFNIEMISINQSA